MTRGALLLLAAGGWLLALAAALGEGSAVAVTDDRDVTFSVTQTPFAPALLPPGSTVDFQVEAVAAKPFSALFFEFDYPDGLAFLSGGSEPPGVPCADDTPLPGIVRCDYGSVEAGALVALRLTFAVADGAEAVTEPGQVRMRAGVADGQPDDAAAGDDAFFGAGSIVASATRELRVTTSRRSVFEGGVVTYALQLWNREAATVGPFDLTVSFTNGAVLDVQCTASPGSAAGSADSNGEGGGCTDAVLEPTGTLTATFVVAAADSAGGADLLPDVEAVSLGVESDTLVEGVVVVSEVGLRRMNATVAVGSAVAVCTDDVEGDVPEWSAAGRRQPGNVLLLRGSVSSSPALQPADFLVEGPGVGEVSAAVGCGPLQSGVSFVPRAAGRYVLTARYNGTGTNVLSFEVSGTAATVSPSPSATGSPSPPPTGTGTPTASGEVRLAEPPPGATVARSRLAFGVETGALAAAEVRVVVRRAADGAYWSAATGAWQAEPVENPALRVGTSWRLPVEGPARRGFVGTTVTVQAVVIGPAGRFQMREPATVHVR